jgi:hypothetical protein
MNGNGREPRRPGRLRILEAALVISIASPFGLYFGLESGNPALSLVFAALFAAGMGITLWQG